ncbi:competence/damage-inducible protein A [Salirhabdus salicampi]|uniref:competence/damage-inducible protein A n=1 Tax=Salirhabdus salicampi TaxID=476102 RepID=UPI0020C2CCA9|nr:competence/damage-inducible protein A [Salirhabdus salicampi]MCP8616453.1 competence/damage-inducible protein A [Salirhabdus salicampi]
MKNIQAEIISVGTELLLGQITDTNSQWLSQKLNDLGVNVYYHQTVGDNADRVTSVLQMAQQRSQLVIVTGGLGPTEDDLTRESAINVLNRSLVIDQTSLKRVEAHFEKNGIPMTENNRKQAVVFENATVFQNDEGMAPGMFVEHEGTGWIFLPGVPREMKAIMNEKVIPFLKQKYELTGQLVSRELKFIGIGESTLEDKISHIIQSQSNPTIAPLAGDDGVLLRLSAKATTKEKGYALIDELQQRIFQVVGEYCYGIDHDTIESTVLNIMEEKHMTLSSAESLTGGRFIEKLVSVPGASKVVRGSIVSYQREVKEKLLLVSSGTIDQYGTISEQCAFEMVENVQNMMHTDISMSFTGNAGPDPIEGKPVGTVYIGIKQGSNPPQIYAYTFHGSRDNIRNRAVKKGYELLYKLLKS